MDEKEALADAALELSREGNIEGVRADLRHQATEAFPVILFLANALKDVLVDPAFDFASVSGIGWVFYFFLLWAPLFVWNFIYLWGKIGFWRKQAYGVVGQLAVRWLIWALVAIGVGSLVPFLNVLFPQCLFILIAHKRNNRLVKELLAAMDIFADAVDSGNPFALRRAAEEYSAYVAANFVRAANVSGRVGDRFGDRARAAAQRLERNVVRAARKEGGRHITRAGIQAMREQRAAAARRPVAPDVTPRVGAATPGAANVRVAPVSQPNYAARRPVDGESRKAA